MGGGPAGLEVRCVKGAEASDLLSEGGAVRELYVARFPESERVEPEEIARDVAAGRRGLWVASLPDARLVALLVVLLDIGGAGRHPVHLVEYLAVDERFEHRGIARALLSAVTRELEPCGAIFEVEPVDAVEPEEARRQRRRAILYSGLGARRLADVVSYAMPVLGDGPQETRPMELWWTSPSADPEPRGEELRQVVRSLWSRSYHIAAGDERLESVVAAIRDREPFFERRGVVANLWRLRPRLTVVASLAPTVAFGVGLGIAVGVVGPASPGVAQATLSRVAQVVATGLGLSLTGSLLAVQLVIGHSPRVVLLYRQLVRGAVAAIGLLGQVLALALIASTLPRPGGWVPFVLADAFAVLAAVPVGLLLLLSALSPACVVTGLTSDLHRLLARAPVSAGRGSMLQRALMEVDAVANYGNRMAAEGSRDAFADATGELTEAVAVAVTALVRWEESEAKAIDPAVALWSGFTLSERWRAVAGELESMLLGRTGVPTLVVALRSLHQLTRLLLNAGLRSEDPLLPLVAMPQVQFLVDHLASSADRLGHAGQVARGDATAAGLVAGALVSSSGVAGCLGFAEGSEDVVWRAKQVLELCRFTFDSRFPMAASDAAELSAVLGAPSPEPSKPSEREPEREALLQLFPELRRLGA